MLAVINYTVIDEEYRALYYEKETREKREDAVNFVKGKLEKEVDLLLEKIGIDEKVIDGLMRNDRETARRVAKILEETKAETGISYDAVKTFNLMICLDSKICTAYRDIRNVLLHKQMIKFAKRAELYPNAWNRFLSYENETMENTVQKITTELSLTDEEYESFRSKILDCRFCITKELADKSTELFKERQITYEEFNEEADITKSVWKAFKKKDSKIQQKTLLKLLIGFKADDETAVGYMKTAGSGFYRKLDIIFRVCIRMGYTNRYIAEAIIDRFVGKGFRGITNPYSG